MHVCPTYALIDLDAKHPNAKIPILTLYEVTDPIGTAVIYDKYTFNLRTDSIEYSYNVLDYPVSRNNYCNAGTMGGAEDR